MADSGTTSHIANSIKMFQLIKQINRAVNGVRKTSAVVKGRGTVQILTNLWNQTKTLTLKDVLYVPEAPNCLFSLGRVDEKGGFMTIKGGQMRIYDSSKDLAAIAIRQDQLYYLRAQMKWTRDIAHISTTKITWTELHRRYGHVGFKSLEWMHEGRARWGSSSGGRESYVHGHGA